MYADFEVNKNGDDGKIRGKSGNEAYPAERSNKVLRKNEQQLQQPVEDINKAKIKVPKKKVLKKKGKANLYSPISSHVQSYSMVEDIKHQQAWITFGQLIEIASKLQGIEVPIDMVVTEAETYSVIVGNDLLRKVKDNIDYETSTMTVSWEGKEARIPVEYQLVSDAKQVEEVEEEGSVKEEEEEIENEDEVEEYKEVLVSKGFINF
ncbi:hypothetical protein RhiirA4_430325 [Rhizophagus irregularis]|uniref:Uncharacterized protein n=1 Tax=Rhizophagus irregularis TaxID=588596 RepID=A0A2I1HKB4_9GLOM|nr:hypothetical protein RhiirA4_430325 [Rhizophagus irregularis]